MTAALSPTVETDPGDRTAADSPGTTMPTLGDSDEDMIEVAAIPSGGAEAADGRQEGTGSAYTGPRFAIGTAENPRPRYPMIARRRGLEGRVVLRVLVDVDGAVRSVEVAQSSTHAVLDDAAAAALRRWRFDPARRAGVPVAAEVEVPIAFRLRD